MLFLLFLFDFTQVIFMDYVMEGCPYDYVEIMGAEWKWGEGQESYRYIFFLNAVLVF